MPMSSTSLLSSFSHALCKILDQDEVRLMLNNLTIKKNKDPSVLFEKISEIQNRYGTAKHKLDKEGCSGRIQWSSDWRTMSFRGMS